jgi:hypothetical protein
MFGCHAIYVDSKMVLILRDRRDHTYDNGVWIATSAEYHAELKTVFPCLRSIRLLGGKRTAWQNIPATADDFEECVSQACAMILKNDPRIGKIPAARKKKIAKKR